MTANAGALRVRAAGLGRPRRREARAVALGVRLHLLTGLPRGLSGRRVRSRAGRPGRATAAVTLASVVSPARRAAIAGPAQATGRCGVTTTCMSGRSRPAAAMRCEHPLRRDQRGGGQHRAPRGATTARPAPRPAARAGRRAPVRSRPTGCRCTRGGARRGRRRPGQRELAPADDDAPADRGLGAVGPVEDGDPGGRRGGVGHRAVRDPGRPARRRCRRGSGRTPARVMSSASSSRCTRSVPLVLLQDDERPGAGALHAGRAAGRGVARAGRTASRDVAQVGDVDPGRPQPLEQAGAIPRTGCRSRRRVPAEQVAQRVPAARAAPARWSARRR